MKKILYGFLPVLVLCFACNNSGGNTESDGLKGKADSLEKAKADSLEKLVMNGHNIAMPQSMKIPDIQKRIQGLIDSIGKLPAKAREAAAPLKTRLEASLKDLTDAKISMEEWMGNFNYDSARDNIEQRIKYLSDEIPRVDKMKGKVLNSIATADSLLKARF